MRAANRRGTNYRMVVGMMLIVVGALMLVDRMGGIDFGGFARWWPLMLIGTGLWKLSEIREGESRSGGMSMIVIGGVFLVKPVLRLLPRGDEFVDELRLWPLFIVAVGAFMVWRALAPSANRKGDQDDAS